MENSACDLNVMQTRLEREGLYKSADCVYTFNCLNVYDDL